MALFAYQFFILRVMIQTATSLQVSVGCQSMQITLPNVNSYCIHMAG
ncbi:hypothetical protein Goari_008514 [Gossypium aridum]|uniref:Uncharacterized protein n=1 Tax=Gossypium aridum TaxID=34290 RepID=A0A7J8XUY6_GOSAI|nr:hypothetical protein [Gossypium aridum]